jgi:hypothetical protein
MSAIHWLAIRWLELGAGVLLAAFVVFAFRQGMKVRPLDPDEQPPVSPSDSAGHLHYSIGRSPRRTTCPPLCGSSRVRSVSVRVRSRRSFLHSHEQPTRHDVSRAIRRAPTFAGITQQYELQRDLVGASRPT